jgi:glycosyltransferase involved in cell wall biosynthesis
MPIRRNLSLSAEPRTPAAPRTNALNSFTILPPAHLFILSEGGERALPASHSTTKAYYSGAVVNIRGLLSGYEEMLSRSASVVVPTRGRSVQLSRLLASFDELTYHPGEVIVAADYDDSDSARLLGAWETKPHAFEARTVKQEGGRGPAAARNLGASAARGEIVAFIDDDCIAQQNWLPNLVRNIDVENKIAGVGGRIVPIRTNLMSRYYGYYGILEPPTSMEYLVSANCCYAKKAMLEAGGFEEDIRKPGGEDVGLSLKLSRRDWHFRFADNAIVYHDFRDGVFDFMKTFRNYGEGCRRVTDRYRALQGSPHNVGARGGYGYGSLAPSELTPDSLIKDFVTTYSSVKGEFGIREGMSFATLRLFQRVSYYYGWVRGN